jgi:uncharacterized membrane protein
MRWPGFAAAYLVVATLDAVWLGWVAPGFYRREIGDLMAADIRWVPALLFYLAYPAALVALALVPRPAVWPLALARSALVGLVAYGTYDLTNMATLKHWSLALALVDMAWGATLSALAGGAAWWVTRRG